MLVYCNNGFNNKEHYNTVKPLNGGNGNNVDFKGNRPNNIQRK